MTDENNPNIHEDNKPKSAGSKSGSAFSGLSESLQSGNTNVGHNKSPKSNMKAKAGSAAMQAMGVPKPIANMAANRLANRKGKGENVPEALKKRNNGMPNSRSSSGSINQKQDGNSKGINSSIGSGLAGALGEPNQKANGEEKGAVQKTAEKAVEKGGSAAMQVAGIPKPVADLVAKKASGPALKIAIIGAVSSFLLWMIIIITVFSLIFLPIYKGIVGIQKIREGVDDFFAKVGHLFSGDGWCASDIECADNAEQKFYTKVESIYKKNTQIDMSIVLASVLYDVSSNNVFDTGNYDYCDKFDGEEKTNCQNETIVEGTATDYNEAKDNLSKVANKLSKGKAEFDKYMTDKFIPNNYEHIMKADNKTSEQILKEIYELSNFFNDYKNITSSNSTGGVCLYSVNGQEVSNVKVRLLNCGGDSPIEGEELVDFEKYIVGVTYAENGAAPMEGLKAQAVAARSFALARAKSMGGSYGIKLEQENGQWILNIRNCTNDQVYCDPDKGCWSNDKYGGDTVYSGYVEGKPLSKPVLSADSDIRKAVASVRGNVLIDSTGNVVLAAYTSVEQTSWNDKAKNGQDYTSILLQQYSNAKTIKANCAATMSGDWATWKQTDPRWASVPLGNSTIGDVGCLITSMAIQLSRSGTNINLPTGVSEFNPGVFVQYNPSMIGYGDCSACYNGTTPWIQSMAPGFVGAGKTGNICGTQQEKVNKISEYINQGYYLVTRVKYAPHGEHWVAIIGTSGNEVQIADPGWPTTELFSYYGVLGANSNCLTTYLYKRID